MPTDNTPKTKAERREAARAEALALKLAQERRDKRNRAITIGALVAGLLALVAIIAVILVPAMKDKQEAQTLKPLGEATAPANVNADHGFTLGADGAAGTDNGPDAPEVSVYLDFMCPGCNSFEHSGGLTLDALRQSGDATVVVHPIAILDRLSQNTQFSTRSAAAAALVGDSAPEAFSAFVTAMFQNQPEENSSGLTNEEIEQIAMDAGVPADVAAKIGDGTAADTYDDWVTAVTDKVTADPALANPAADNNFTTPAIAIEGTRFNGDWSDPDVFTAAIEAAQG